MAFLTSRLLFTGCVGATHILMLALTLRGPAPTSRAEALQPEAAIVQLIVVPGERGTVPLPDVQLVPVAVDIASELHVPFEDPDVDDLSGVIGAASAPRLSRVQSSDPASFARRAGLAVGQAVTVMLALEITSEGWVGSAHLTRGSGNSAVDAAAIDYALSLRWIPGSRDSQPQSMRINFPVTLVRN